MRSVRPSTADSAKAQAAKRVGVEHVHAATTEGALLTLVQVTGLERPHLARTEVEEARDSTSGTSESSCASESRCRARDRDRRRTSPAVAQCRERLASTSPFGRASESPARSSTKASRLAPRRLGARATREHRPRASAASRSRIRPERERHWSMPSTIRLGARPNPSGRPARRRTARESPWAASRPRGSRSRGGAAEASRSGRAARGRDGREVARRATGHRRGNRDARLGEHRLDERAVDLCLPVRHRHLAEGDAIARPGEAHACRFAHLGRGRQGP